MCHCFHCLGAESEAQGQQMTAKVLKLLSDKLVFQPTQFDSRG